MERSPRDLGRVLINPHQPPLRSDIGYRCAIAANDATAVEAGAGRFVSVLLAGFLAGTLGSILQHLAGYRIDANLDGF